MSSKNSQKADNSPTDKSLIFELSEATQFKPGLFDHSTISDPEIDLLTVKAINRSTQTTDITDNEELEIEHGMMILNSHRKELAELEDLEESKVSNKKIAVVIIILLFFITFVVIMFLVSKLIDKSSLKNNKPGRVSTIYNNG